MPDEVADEGYVVRFHRLPEELHLSIVRRAVSLFIVTLHTRGDKIFPGILPRFCLWEDVIDSEGNIGSTAVLATMTVASEDIFS